MPLIETSHATLHVDGMTCRSCAANVQELLAERDGVREVSVDLASKRVRVAFDPARVTVEGLAEALTQAEYPAARAE